MTNNIYIDESGYTGFDLLNTDQPFQAASAVCISERGARELISKHFPKIQAAELKYSSLARRESNWDNLLELQKELLSDYFCCSSVCDKRYMLLLMFVDYAVEPCYHSIGFDLYEEGANVNMAAAAYFAGEAFFGKENYQEFLQLFQTAMRSKSDVAISSLVEKAKSLDWNQFPECFGPLARESEDCIEAIKTPEVTTDIAYPLLLGLINRIEATMNASYSVIHDRSRNLERYNSELNRLISNTDIVEFKATIHASINFPLKLKSVVQVDSKNSAGVQLADILVGGIIDAAKAIVGVKANRYNLQILDLYRDDQLIHYLPNKDLEETKVERAGTQANEIIEYMSSLSARDKSEKS